jgi:1,4-alpha-glucan branching enzyme
MNSLKYLLLILLIPFLGMSQNKDSHQPKPYVQLKHPEWSKNATIYEVNIRQYTKEGTFKAFEKHLPRLKKWALIFFG